MSMFSGLNMDQLVGNALGRAASMPSGLGNDIGSFLQKYSPQMAITNGDKGAWVGGSPGAGSRNNAALMDIAKQFVGTQTFGGNKASVPMQNPPSQTTARSLKDIIGSLLGGF